MEKVKQFFDMDFKKAWIISGIIFILDAIFLAFCPFLEKTLLTVTLYHISNFIITTLIISVALLLLKNLEIKKAWHIVLSIFSLILGIFFPLASLLPLITLTAVTSEKKSNIPMWILGIILIILAAISMPLGILMMVFASDAGIPTGIGGFIYYAIFYYIVHKPLITLYTVLLGNKKSYWYYLILLPEVAVILFLIGYDIFMYFVTKLPV